MSKQTLKDYSGQITGYIDTDSRGVQTLKNYSGTILGYYKPDRNITQNYSGTILGYGNTLTTLLSSAPRRQEPEPEYRSQKSSKPRASQPTHQEPAREVVGFSAIPLEIFGNGLIVCVLGSIGLEVTLFFVALLNGSIARGEVVAMDFLKSFGWALLLSIGSWVFIYIVTQKPIYRD